MRREERQIKMDFRYEDDDKTEENKEFPAFEEEDERGEEYEEGIIDA